MRCLALKGLMQELTNSVKWVLLTSSMKSKKALLFDLGNVLLPIELISVTLLLLFRTIGTFF